MGRVGVCLLAVLVAGCAARGGVRPPAAPAAPPRTAKAPAPAGARAVVDAPSNSVAGASGAAGDLTQAPGESLATFIGKVRERSWRATASTASTGAQLVETSDPDLAMALAAQTFKPTAAGQRRVANAYRRLGILDKAHEYFSAAVTVDPRDAASWDGLARIWRDWGLPHLALSDAHRAVYFAPSSAAAHNTLGTVLQAIGRGTEARAEFEAALRLDPRAAWALSNLCYGWLLDGQARQAADACRHALEVQPGFAPARNNLALAHASADDMPAAAQVLSDGGDEGRAQFNLGTVYLAKRRFADASRAFEKARALRPPSKAMDILARQARTLADGDHTP